MGVYLTPKTLIVDEFGIRPYDRDSATAFFTLVPARYEQEPQTRTGGSQQDLRGVWSVILGVLLFNRGTLLDPRGHDPSRPRHRPGTISDLLWEPPFIDHLIYC